MCIRDRDAAHGGHDGGRDDILAGDELDIFSLAGQLTVHGRSQLRVGLFHEADGIHHIVVPVSYTHLDVDKRQEEYVFAKKAYDEQYANLSRRLD